MQDASLHVSASSDGTNTRGRRSTARCPSGSSMVSGGGAFPGVTKTMAGESLLRIHLNSFLRSSRRVTFELPVISPSHHALSNSACTISRDHLSSGAQYFEMSANDSSGLVMGNIVPSLVVLRVYGLTRPAPHWLSALALLRSTAKRENCAPSLVAP